MDILSLTFTGNLTQDCTSNIVNDKTVINFTAASNIDTKGIVYFNCSYWIKERETLEDDKKRIEDYLKKGVKVTVQSTNMKKVETVGADGTKYSSINVIVSKVLVN